MSKQYGNVCTCFDNTARVFVLVLAALAQAAIVAAALGWI